MIVIRDRYTYGPSHTSKKNKIKQVEYTSRHNPFPSPPKPPTYFNNDGDEKQAYGLHGNEVLPEHQIYLCRIL